MRRAFAIMVIGAGALAAPTAGQAGEADVTAVTFRTGNTYTFNVTVRHADEGWDHYANRWEVVSMDGNVIATRVLAHPHVNEQPFTRSLSGIRLPAGTKQVRLRAHDSVHGHGGTDFIVDLETKQTRKSTGEQS